MSDNPLDELLQSTTKQSILVGICGETGQGKSSLINALLDLEIAPTSEAEACTAAVCVFAWNPQTDPEKVFHAKITYKSVDSIKQELSTYLEEIHELAEIKPEEYDAEVRARKDTIKKNTKLIMAWSGLNEDAVTNAANPQEIIKKCQHQLFKTSSPDVSRSELIYSPTMREFAKLLAPFVDSKNRKKKEWPLVELVEIFVRADVLQHGIKIVDLPGVMDALEARCAVAKSYMWRLDKRIVVVPPARSSDNKTAMDLMLPSADIMDMQLDDQFNHNSLAVAVNCIDNIGIANAEDEWGEDDESLKDLCGDLESKKQLLTDLKEEMGEVLEDMDEVRTSGQLDIESDIEGEVIVPQKRGNRAADHPKSPALETLEIKLRRLKTNRQSIDDECSVLEHQITRRCIAARNRHIISVYEENAKEASEDGLSTGTTNVFPNSARAYTEMRCGRSMRGFDEIESTGIDALRRWIIAVSLPHREEAARGHIQSLNILFDASSGWIQMGEIDFVSSCIHNKHGRDAWKAIKDLHDKLNQVPKAQKQNLMRISNYYTGNSIRCVPANWQQACLSSASP